MKKDYLDCFAKSLAGHDEGRIYYIADISMDGKCVSLVDGETRKISMPKIKKIKHIQIIKMSDATLSEARIKGTLKDEMIKHSIKMLIKTEE